MYLDIHEDSIWKSFKASTACGKQTFSIDNSVPRDGVPTPNRCSAGGKSATRRKPAMEMKMTVDAAKERALELMFRGYH